MERLRRTLGRDTEAAGVMKVSRAWLEAFEAVMAYQFSSHGAYRADEIEECKQEAREHEAWALEFYPKAAEMIKQ